MRRALSPISFSVVTSAKWQQRRVGGAVALLFAAATLFACTQPDRDPNPGPVAIAGDTVEVPTAIQERLGFEIVVARHTEVSESITAPAVVAFDERKTARLGSPVEGRVRDVLALVGDRVTEGQILAWLYSPNWEATVAQLRTASASERSASAELQFALQQHARARRLFAAKAAALQELERARLDVVIARNKVRAARAELSRARRDWLALGGGKANDVHPSGLPLRSPIHGTVVERPASPGQGIVPGSPLFTVAQLDTLWLLAEVDERWLNKLTSGTWVRFKVSAYPNETFTATIEYISDVLDPKTRRVKVRCTVDNRDGKLKPEMFAELEISEPHAQALLVIPQSAVQQLDGRSVVFVPIAESKFQQRPVEIGRVGDGWVEVKSGLRHGDRVVARGSFLLKSTLVLRAHPSED
ncbi:MAG: efflux RND transporter periplasmic adaptor subunit [Candidatus Binatia bacterium]|nr:efflux RND transporter periplasmic adaptor subunit [Candidatus Binatia bacterium]